MKRERGQTLRFSAVSLSDGSHLFSRHLKLLPPVATNRRKGERLAGLVERQPQFLRPLTHPVHFFLKDLDRACPASLFMVA
jgi:hypothetical protein